MKRVLVTGASGFIGRHCIEILKKKGLEVYAASSQIKPAFEENISWLNFNIHNPTETQKIIREIKPTHLLHLAWYAEPSLYVNSNENFRWLYSSLELIKVFAEYGGKRIVTAGSCFELYTNSLYGACKASLEQISNAFGIYNEISTAHGRVFYLFGPFENKSRVIPYVINMLISGQEANCSHGEQIRDFLYVYDVANAFVKILDSDIKGSLDIGSGEGIKLKELFSIIQEHIGGKGIINLNAIPASKDEPKEIIANNYRLINEINWEPEFTIKESVIQTVNWWRENGNR